MVMYACPFISLCKYMFYFINKHHAVSSIERNTSSGALFISTQNCAYGEVGGGVANSIEVENNTAYSKVKTSPIVVQDKVIHETNAVHKYDDIHDYY